MQTAEEERDPGGGQGLPRAEGLSGLAGARPWARLSLQDRPEAGGEPSGCPRAPELRPYFVRVKEPRADAELGHVPSSLLHTRVPKKTVLGLRVSRDAGSCVCGPAFSQVK